MEEFIAQLVSQMAMKVMLVEAVVEILEFKILQE